MHSPLARVILAILSGYVLILLLMTAYNWIKTEYPQAPECRTALFPFARCRWSGDYEGRRSQEPVY
jgi:hypothetical protein